MRAGTILKAICTAILIAVPTVSIAETIEVGIDGMTCSSCARKLEAAFKGTERVESVKIDLDEAKAKIETSAGATLTDDELKKVVSEAGYSVRSIERDS